MKRFSESTDWREPWYRKLSPQAKHLRRFLWDNCDCCGIVSVDLDYVTYHVGQEINEHHLAELGDWLEPMPNGKYLIPSFIDFQCGELRDSCPAHRPVMRDVLAHNLVKVGKLYHFKDSLSSSLLGSHSDSGLEVERDKEKEVDLEVEKEKEPPVPIQSNGHRKPSSVEEVITRGQFVGVSEQECRDWYRDCEFCNWTRGDGTPFDNWPRQLIIHRDKIRASKPTQKSKASIFELKEIVKVKEEKAALLRAKNCSEVAMGDSWDDPAKRAEYYAIKKEIKELKQKIEAYA